MVCQIKVFPDGLQEVALLPVAEFLVIRLILHVNPGILLDKLVICIQIGMVNPQRFGFGVRVYIVRFSCPCCLFGHNGYAALWSNHIFNKKGSFTHHRSPSCFIPSYRTISKANLQLAIIIIICRNIFSQARANGIDLYRFRAGHLTHHINIMHATIYNRTEAFHQVAVNIPHLAVALLIEVHAHHQGFAKFTGNFHKLCPRRMVAENIAHYYFLICFLSSSNHSLSAFYSSSQGFFNKDMTTLLEGLYCKGFMGVGISRDTNCIRPGAF